MATRILTAAILVLVFFTPLVHNYEKTLRKIVRDQSRMVQTPISDIQNGALPWRKLSEQSESILAAGLTQTKILHKTRPKISTILSSPLDNSGGKSAHSKRFLKNIPAEIDLDLSQYANFTPIVQLNAANEYFTDQKSSNLTPSMIHIEPYYRVPTMSKYFPNINNEELQNIEQNSSKIGTVNFPVNLEPKDDDDSQTKSIYIANKNNTTGISKPRMPPQLGIADDRYNLETEKDKNYLSGDISFNADTSYSFNATVNTYICKDMKVAAADIDAQEKFSSFDIEPRWTSKKHYWSAIYDSRYETLMRNPKWPPLQVILVPRTHVDSIWKKTFENYHNDSVSKILANIVKKLNYYTNMTFTWNEVSHLSRWWKKTSHRSRSTFKKLLKSGRLEITTGAWVEPDEATTDLFGLVHILVEGHEWLKSNLNYFAKTGWLTSSVVHSPTMTYLLSALDIVQLVITNVHYSWEQYLAEYQQSDFVWLQNWETDSSISTPLNDILKAIGRDRYPKLSTLTHYLQFNYADFRACGPNNDVCCTDYNFAQSNKNLDINSYNIKKKSEILLAQYSKTGTITPHNIVIAPIGGPYMYELQSEYDYQYNNYQKIADFINYNRGIYKASVQFGTPKDYFKILTDKMKKYSTLKGDFLNFADITSGSPAYWVGYYTSRPFFKIMLRRLESTLRTTEILVSFAVSLNAFRGYNSSSISETLLMARESLARLMDRNVATGTLPSSTQRYAYNLILETVTECWSIQEVVVSLLTSKPEINKRYRYLKKYAYREGEFLSSFKTVSSGDYIYIFNSLSHERTEIIELVTRHPNIRVLDYNRKDVTVQLNPVWKYSSDNVIKISRRFFKISFAVVIPPMTLVSYKIKTTYDPTHNAAIIYCSSCVIDDVDAFESTFPFDIKPIQTGDILLESYKYRLIFDELTGFLNTVVEKETNTAKSVVIDFGAFKDAHINSGMFLFNTDAARPIIDILAPYRARTMPKVTMIISGLITSELTTVFGRFLHHTVRIYNMIQSPLSVAIYIENMVDYDVSPKNRDLELFMSIQTDVGNGNPPQIFTDNNAFQYTGRVLNISRRIESNVYPITTMAYIEDHRSRLTYITDHTQGVTSLQEGQLLVILDRRVLFNDGRGTNEGLSDSIATCHRHIILLESFVEQTSKIFPMAPSLNLPSLSAISLSNMLNYVPDIFLVDQNKTKQCHYGFLPLIKVSFPCDISVVNFRAVLKGSDLQTGENTALLILHRRSFSCRVDMSNDFRCDGEVDFALDRILHNVRSVYQTNLAGTNKGTPLFTSSTLKLPPMELSTLRIYF